MNLMHLHNRNKCQETDGLQFAISIFMIWFLKLLYKCKKNKLHRISFSIVFALIFRMSHSWSKITLFSLQWCLYVILVKVQFRGPKLYKKRGALFQKESYLSRIFGSSSLNLHTFHLINIVFWWRIFFCKHNKSTPKDRQCHHVLVTDVMIMTSQCRCMRAISQSHIAKHDNHTPVKLLTGSALAVISMQWLPYGKIISAKTLKLHSNWGHPSTIVSPTCSWRQKDTR